MTPTLEQIEGLIDIWSMRPAPDTEAGMAWEDGARQGWQWAIERIVNLAEAWRHEIKKNEQLRARIAKLEAEVERLRRSARLPHQDI